MPGVSRFPVFKLFPAGLQALLKVDEVIAASGLSKRIWALIKMRCSTLNGCAFCEAMHSAGARDGELRPDEIEALSQMCGNGFWDDEDGLVLSLCDVLTRLEREDQIRQAVQSVIERFGVDEATLMCYAIAQINAWNRIAMAGGMTASDFLEHT